MLLGLKAGSGGVEGGERNGTCRWWGRERGVRGNAETGRRGDFDGRGQGVSLTSKLACGV